MKRRSAGAGPIGTRGFAASWLAGEADVVLACAVALDFAGEAPVWCVVVD